MIATLGFTPEPLAAPLKHYTVDDLFVLYGPPGKPETDKALAEVHTMSQLFDVQVHDVALPDAFDYAYVLRKMEEIHHALPPGTEVLVNGSGGPRPMTMAATIFAAARDLPLLYYDSYACKEGKVIPLRAYKGLPDLGARQRSILQRLQKGSADMGQLAKDLKLAPSTLTEHIQGLERMGAVVVAQEGRRRHVALEPDLMHMDLEAA